MGKTFRVGKDLICGELKIKRWDEYVVALRKGLKLKSFCVRNAILEERDIAAVALL